MQYAKNHTIYLARCFVEGRIIREMLLNKNKLVTSSCHTILLLCIQCYPLVSESISIQIM